MICTKCDKDVKRLVKQLCDNCYGLKWRKENPERNRENCRRWRKENPEKSKQARRRYYESCLKKRCFKTNIREKTITKKLEIYGISQAYYDLCLDKGCKLCTDKFEKTPCLDHDHKTGKFRGVLCHRCNTGLGYFRDNPEVLKRAIQYIQ